MSSCCGCCQNEDMQHLKEDDQQEALEGRLQLLGGGWLSCTVYNGATFQDVTFITKFLDDVRMIASLTLCR